MQALVEMEGGDEYVSKQGKQSRKWGRGLHPTPRVKETGTALKRRESHLS